MTHDDRIMRLQAAETAKWESERAEAARRLKRDRRELDQQARELLKLPTRKERNEVRTRTRLCAPTRLLLACPAKALLWPA